MPHEHDLVPESTPAQSERTVSVRSMEIVVSALFMLVAIVVMGDSWRVGMGWAFDGPQAGYFPFYIGLIMFIAAAANFARNLFASAPDLTNFVGRPALRLVLQVLAPAAIYVVALHYLGIYLASALFIGFFMVWLGKYSLAKAAPVAIAIPLVLFWLFEIAFLIPLPKGPIESALGF